MKNPTYPNLKQAIGLMLMYIVFTFAAAIPILVIALIWLPIEEAIENGLVMMFLTAIPPIITVWYGLNRRGGWATLNIGKVPSTPMVIWAMLMIIGASLFLDELLQYIVPYYDYWVNLLEETIGSGLWMIFPVIVIAPIFEEILCRDIILGGLLKQYNPKKAIVISALIFGILHMNPLQFVSATVMGILLGYIYWRSGSLLLVIIIHAINNSIATAIYYLSEESTLVLIKDQPILNALIMVIAGALMAWLAYQQFNRQDGLLPADHHVVTLEEELPNQQAASSTE